MNRLVHGDCLDVMAGLAGGVRLAYLDPPFNTGERFADFHDAMDRRAWLAAIEPRLLAAWSLLREDGSLWVHCDDAEQAALRVLLDDALGREAFVATVVWQRRYSRENRRAFSPAHDYLHVYAPAGAAFKHHRNRLPRNDPPGTWRDDGDPRGPWSTVSLVAQGGHATRAQFYAIALPSGRVVEPPRGSCWRVTRERYDALVAAGLVWCGAGGDNVPRRKVFLRDAQGLVPSTWWTHEEAGHNAEASAEQRRLFPGERPFSTPEARAADGADHRHRHRPGRPRARPVPRLRDHCGGGPQARPGVDRDRGLGGDDRPLRGAAPARGRRRLRPRRHLGGGRLGGRRRLRAHFACFGGGGGLSSGLNA